MTNEEKALELETEAIAIGDKIARQHPDGGTASGGTVVSIKTNNERTGRPSIHADYHNHYFMNEDGTYTRDGLRGEFVRMSGDSLSAGRYTVYFRLIK